MDKHNWLLRVLSGLWENLEKGTYLEEPRLLGFVLSPERIRKEILSINFHPINNLGLNAQGVVREARDDVAGVEVGTALRVFIYWHEDDGDPTHPKEFKNEYEVTSTLKEALNGFTPNARIDGIVFRKSMHIVDNNPPKVPSEAENLEEALDGYLDNILEENETYFWSYDIFLPTDSNSKEESVTRLT